MKYITKFLDSLGLCLTKYAVFSGRSSRQEFWYFTSFVYVVTAVLGAASDVMGIVFMFLMIIPSSAVTSRRLHDADLSGWYQVLTAIPVIGIFICLALCAKESKDPNRYEEKMRSQIFK